MTPSPAAAPAVLSTATALPSHRYEQDDLVELARQILPDLDLRERVLRRFFRRVGVDERYLALDAHDYEALHGFEARNDAWLAVATDVAERCLEDLFAGTDVAPGEVGELVSTTVTGLSVPTLDARLMNRMPFSPALKRVPLFGLGCVGGAAGVARVADYLRAFPEEAAVLLSVELCSLTLQRDDLSLANLIAMGLFGDGAAAVLMVGAEHPRAHRAAPTIVDSESVFFPDTESMMGWNIVDSGFEVVLDPDVPDLARDELPAAVDGFLDDHDLVRDDIATWVSHPGGPAVMDSVAEGLDLVDGELRAAREGLAEVGNLSSASVLFLLDEHRSFPRPEPGAWGLMIAMGPAFCAELVLLQW